MPGGLDSFLDVVIPIAIFAMFGFMIYKQFKTEIDAFISWVSKKMHRNDEENLPYKVYNNPYLGETIVYQ